MVYYGVLLGSYPANNFTFLFQLKMIVLDYERTTKMRWIWENNS